MLDTISSLSAFTPEECQSVRSIVYELKEYWVQRNSFVPFYTLGAASYIDAARDQQDYYTKAQRYNFILRDRLGWLYERLADTLTQFLKAPTSYQHSLALPGFHVYLSCKFFEQSIASIHFDLQYQLVNWELIDQTDFSNPISFTLAISLPKNGGGLQLWELSHQEMMEIPQSELKQFLSSSTKHYYPYQIGQIVLHSGHTLHQIAPGKNLQPDDDRITLQGHALFSQGHWQLYW